MGESEKVSMTGAALGELHEVEVIAVRFNHKKKLGNNDAFSIGNKEAVKGYLPEWQVVYDTEKKTETIIQHPAVYFINDDEKRKIKINDKTTIMVAFKSIDEKLKSAYVRAKVIETSNIKGSCFGDIKPTKINFSGCRSKGGGKCEPVDSYDGQYIEIKHIKSDLSIEDMDRIEKFVYRWEFSTDGDQWKPMNQTEHEIFLATKEELYALKNDIADRVNYWGLDPKIAQTANETIYKTITNYPELRSVIKFIGSIKSLKQYIGYRPSKKNKELQQFIENLDKDCLAIALRPHCDDVQGIFINDDHPFSPLTFSHLNFTRIDAESRGWCPKGCKTVKSLIDHELGHSFDYLLGILDSEEMRGIHAYVKDQAKKQKITEEDYVNANLSKYAGNSVSFSEAKIDWTLDALFGIPESGISEWIAEAWSEYTNNSSCRDLAQRISNIIIDAYNKKFSKN